MKKKFKVRIVNSLPNSQYYKIQYCYYYFIPIWFYINDWCDFGPTHTLAFWSPVIYKYMDAVNFASKFKSIEDVYSYIKSQMNLHEKYIKDRNDWIKSVAPVKCQNII